MRHYLHLEWRVIDVFVEFKSNLWEVCSECKKKILLYTVSLSFIFKCVID